MKTIRPISTVALATLSLAFAAQAQQTPDNPEPPKAPEPPLELKPHLEEPAPPAVERPMQEPAEQRIQRLLQDRVRGQMMLPDQENQFRPQWLIGVVVEPIEPFVRAHLGLEEDAGTRVTRVEEETPAARAGIQVDDIIISADGGKVATIEVLRAAVEKAGKEGKPLSLEILHRGQRKTLNVVPTGPKPPETPDVAPQPQPQPERPFVELLRRLDRQEQAINELRAELRKLRRKVNN